MDLNPHFYFSINRACIVGGALSLNCSCDQNTTLWRNKVRNLFSMLDLRKGLAPPDRGKDSALALELTWVWGGFVCWIRAYPQVSRGQLLWQVGRQLCNYQLEETDSSNSLNTCLLQVLSSTLPHLTLFYTYCPNPVAAPLHHSVLAAWFTLNYFGAVNSLHSQSGFFFQRRKEFPP